jgi:hypothetical protein
LPARQKKSMECRSLEDRGIAELRARLAAGVAIAVIGLAFERWIDPDNDRRLAELTGETLAEIDVLALGPRQH